MSTTRGRLPECTGLLTRLATQTSIRHHDTGCTSHTHPHASSCTTCHPPACKLPMMLCPGSKCTPTIPEPSHPCELAACNPGCLTHWGWKALICLCHLMNDSTPHLHKMCHKVACHVQCLSMHAGLNLCPLWSQEWKCVAMLWGSHASCQEHLEFLKEEWLPSATNNNGCQSRLMQDTHCQLGCRCWATGC